MSELTTERLEEMKSNVFSLKSISEAEQIAMIDELLSLRTAAAPGDEEVLYLRAVVCNGIWSKDKRDHEEADKAIDRIVSKAVSLRNELRSAREEIERLKESVDSRVPSLVAQIATLTAERDELKSGNDFLRQEIEDWKEANRRAEAERDEARKEVERLRMAVGCATTIKGDMVMRADDPLGMMQEVCAYVKSLRSCPEMGEVDAIEDWLEGKEIEFGVVRRIKRLVEMVGQLSAALTEERNARVLAQKQRDEIILDLNTVDRVDYLGELRHMAAYIGSEPSDAIFAARRILAICGKGVGT